MSQLNPQNTQMLEVVCKYLEPLLDRFVLVGGCATALLIDDEAAPIARPTLDVDLIVDVISWSAYHTIEEELRKIGFRQIPDEHNVICRWKIDSVMVDIMPTSEKILGFSNPWYKPACECSVSTKLPNGLTVKHVTAPYFIATKIEAFNGRGEGDFMMSHDMEDIISIIDGRKNLINEISESNNDVKSFIATEIKKWLADDDFEDILPGMLPPDGASQARLGHLTKSLSTISEQAL